MTKRTQVLVLFAAAMVYILTTTAIAWKAPDSDNWVLGVTVVLAVIFCYTAVRRAVPPDFKGGKWAATVLVLGGETTSNNLTPTQRTVAFFIIMGVILTGIVLALVWPDRPSWVLWAETSLMLGIFSFLVVKVARKTTR